MAPTMRVAVGALTPSAVATSHRRARPIWSMVTRADSCDGVKPLVSEGQTAVAGETVLADFRAGDSGLAFRGS